MHIFFGDEDDVARADRLWDACRSTARWNDNVSYHNLQGATHGYDDPYGGAFSCCNPPVYVQVVRDDEAVAVTRNVIVKAMQNRWD